MAAIAMESKSTTREKWAWYFYDFGNSAYAAVVLLAIYSAYFQGTVVGGAEGSRLWGIAVGIAMLFVAVTAPILGTIADYSGSKKQFLLFYTTMCVIFCALLFFVQEGTVVMGMLFFILAEIGYRSAQVFYNSLLPEIAYPDEMGMVSGNGWAFGSFGGIICLAIVLAAVMFLGDVVLPTAMIVRIALVFTAAYFIAAALPVFLLVKERAEPRPLPAGETYISLAFKRLGSTFRAVWHYREFLKFMFAFLIYNDGILMVMDFAAILGAVLFGMEQQEMIIFMIAVQVTSVIGAYLFGWVTKKLGSKQSLLISLALMIVPVIWLLFSYSKVEFYIIGAIAGFALTGVQSVSRTAVGLFAPEAKSAEFYGFFAVAGRTSSFIGPTIFGLLAHAATRWYERGVGVAQVWTFAGQTAEQSGHRFGLLSIVVFLLIGLALLLWVNEKKARAAATAAAGAED
jgi:UMF1 family MFS transporter